MQFNKINHTSHLPRIPRQLLPYTKINRRNGNLKTSFIKTNQSKSYATTSDNKIIGHQTPGTRSRALRELKNIRTSWRRGQSHKHSTYLQTSCRRGNTQDFQLRSITDPVLLFVVPTILRRARHCFRLLGGRCYVLGRRSAEFHRICT